MFGTKPKSVKIDLSKVKPSELEYFCKSSKLTEASMKALNLPFDKRVSDDMELEICFYFVVLKNRNYDVISSVTFDAWQKQNDIDLDIEDFVLTAKAKACFDHFVKFLVGEHQKHKEKLPVYTKQKFIN